MENLLNRNLAERKQVEYLVRMFLVNLCMNMPISIWYSLKKNNENDPADREDNSGIVWNKSQLKLTF
ncbi:hypothetical protein GCM10020331_024640 [Ectobacillus funiculus]